MSCLPPLGRALGAELLKARRTPALMAVIGAPLCVVLLIAVEPASARPQEFWGSLRRTTMMAWALLLLPLLVTVEAALLAGLEHGNQGWKHLLALPIPRWSLYAAKMVIAFVAVGAATIVVIGGMIAVGYVKIACKPGLADAGGPPLSATIIAGGRVWLASGLLVAVQSWVSLRWAHFAVPIGLGIAGTVLALFATGSALGTWSPWLMPFRAIPAERWFAPLWLGTAGGLVAGAIACLELASREEGERGLPHRPFLLAAAGHVAFFAGALLLVPRISWRSLEQRLSCIETSLRPAVEIKGRPAAHRLTDRMAFYQVPGVSIAFLQGGRVVWAKGYGVGDAVAREPVTTATVFQAASISKPLTAATVLSIVAQRQLSMDEDINRSLRSWQLPENQWTTTRKVTLRNLLDHTAGIEEHRVEGYPPQDPLPSTLQVLNGTPPAIYPAITVVAEPGSRFGYSGGGYVILQQWLCDTVGASFPEIVRQTLLDPVGMGSSTFDPTSSLLARAASGHTVDGVRMPGRWRLHPELAAGGLWTTPTDLGRFACELLRCYQGESTQPLSRDMARAMLTKGLGPMGFGMMVDGKDPVGMFLHEGANPGYRCSMVMNAERGEGIVVMTNADRGGNLMREIVRAVGLEFGWSRWQPIEREPVAADPRHYEAFAGLYRADGNEPAEIRVTTTDRRLFLQTATLGPAPVELLPLGSHRFFVLEDDGDIVFETAPDGRVLAIVSEAEGASLRAPRVQ